LEFQTIGGQRPGKPRLLPTPTFYNETLETAWANHSEKLHGQPYEREAATSQSLTETCNIHRQVTHKVQTWPYGAPESGLARRSGLLRVIYMKIGVGQESRIY
jgi:hypothetical protein